METKQLMIRQFNKDDYDDFSELIRNKMASEYAKYDDQFPTDDQSLHGILGYFSESDEFFAVELKSEHKVIGFVSLNYVDDQTRNLGYCIHSAYQGKGYGSEAVAELKRYAKEDLKLNKLVSGTAAVNIPSVRLLEKFDFKQVSQGSGNFSDDIDETFITYSYECIL